jgi:hypothetical protein
MTADERAKFTRTLRKMQRKGLIAVAVCVLLAAALAVGINIDAAARRANPIAIYCIAAVLLAAGAFAFNSNFIKLPARFDRLMKALEAPGAITNVQIGVVAANEAVANSAVAQWYVEIQLRDETIDLVPGAKADAEALAAIIQKQRVTL